MKQRYYKFFRGPEMRVPDVRYWINQIYRALSSCSSCATFSKCKFCFTLSLVSKMLANFMLVSLFLWISEICCLLTPYSSDKLVPFSPFSNRTIIDCLSFIKKNGSIALQRHDDREQTFVTRNVLIPLKERDEVVSVSLPWLVSLRWLKANKLSLNVTKTEFMVISSRQKLQSLNDYTMNIHIDGVPINQSIQSKSLGLIIDEGPHSWNL